MKILLVNPPWKLSIKSVYSKTGAIYPPLGLAYIAAYLKKSIDIDADILDARGLGLSFDDYREELKNGRYTLVGIISYTPTSEDTAAAARIAKQIDPETTVVIGGPHATILTDTVLADPHVDLIVKGEGEETFKELVTAISNKTSLHDIAGISFKEDGRIHHNPQRPVIADIDQIPFPARNKLPMHIYRPASGAYKRLPVTSIITSRGCPFQCSFCSKAIFGSSVRQASPELVIEEIKSLIGDYHIKELYFCDDSFTLKRERIVEICELMIRHGLDLTWSCSTRVNLVDVDLLKLMKRAGCISIGYGVESGDERILSMIKKGVSLSQVSDTIKQTRDAGIESRTSYIFGFPGENPDTMTKTLNFAKTLNSDFVIFNLAIPLPGTEIYRLAKEKGVLKYDGEDLYTRCDGAQPLIDLPDMTEDELVRFYRKAYKSYYLRPKYLASRIRTIKSFDDLKLNIKGFFEFVSWNMD